MNDLVDRFADTLDAEDAVLLEDVRLYVAWQSSRRAEGFRPGNSDDVDLRTYLLERRIADDGSGEASLQRILASLQRFYEWALAGGQIPTTPFAEHDWNRLALSRSSVSEPPARPSAGPQQEIGQLRALNRLAAVLNRSAAVKTALEATLDTVLEVLGLRTAWISLSKGSGFARYATQLASSPTYVLAAARGLPPGLEQDDYHHLTSGGECRCQALLGSGRLNHAVNVVECSRLQRAAAAEGDTQGLRFHATVPILLHEQPLGMLNVATNDWQFLSAADLQMLTAAGLQIAAALERARLYEISQAQSTRMERELLMARAVQASLLPQRLPDTPGFGIAADWRAAREMAGDFYDVIPLAGGRTAIVVADVLDKGAPAALYMVLVRSLVRTQAEQSSSPAEILTRVNRQLVAQSSAGMFVTVFLGILDPSTCELTYASAGHPPPLLRRASTAGKPEPLARGGPLLGVFEEVEMVEYVTHLFPGDLLVAYTDGLTEAHSPDSEMFGEKRLFDLVEGQRSSSAQELVQILMSSAAAWGGGAPQSDDITILVVRCQPH